MRHFFWMFPTLILSLGYSGWAATPAARNLVVTESYIAATDHEYKYLWIINRKTHRVAATLDVDELPRQFIRELRGLRVDVVDLLIQTDPASVLGLRVAEGKKHVYTLRDPLPYPFPPTDYQVERLLPRRMPGRAVLPAGKRVFLFPSLPYTPFYYDLEAAELVIGARRVAIDSGKRQQGPYGDAIADLPRGKIYVPFSRGGKHGVAVLHLRLGKDESGRPNLESVDLGEFLLDTDWLGGRGVVSPDGSRLYLVSESLKVIDLENQKIVDALDPFQPLPAYPLQYMIALSPDGGELYLLEESLRALEARDSHTYELLWAIELPRF